MGWIGPPMCGFLCRGKGVSDGGSRGFVRGGSSLRWGAVGTNGVSNEVGAAYSEGAARASGRGPCVGRGGLRWGRGFRRGATFLALRSDLRGKFGVPNLKVEVSGLKPRDDSDHFHLLFGPPSENTFLMRKWARHARKETGVVSSIPTPNPQGVPPLFCCTLWTQYDTPGSIGFLKFNRLSKTGLNFSQKGHFCFDQILIILHLKCWVGRVEVGVGGLCIFIAPPVVQIAVHCAPRKSSPLASQAPTSALASKKYFSSLPLR